jgi:hypothetical protein
MDEEQAKARRPGKQRAGGSEGAKQQLSRAERLSARTLAKVCRSSFFAITENDKPLQETHEKKNKKAQLPSSDAEDEA